MTQSTTTSIRAVPARVRRVNQLSPHLTRVTLHSPAFAELSFLGSDQYLRLLLPRAHQSEPRLPLTDRWWPDMLAMPAAERPTLRNYTVADLRPGTAEMDIDFVRHGDVGPATRWVNRAAPGAAVGVIEQGLLHEVRADVDEYLIVGDETALPAAAGVLLALPRPVTATALLEVPAPEDQRDLPSLATTRVRYLSRQDPHARPGSLLADAVRDWRPSGDRVVAWVAGEQSMVKAVRRILVRAGVPKADICFHGYFKFGSAQY
jgi:NADPH-dependent ferric siderophore reductase